MKKFFRKFDSLVFPFVILIIVGVIFWQNYIPGTYLSGWDTLHPEFNIPLYLKRVFWGVWQEHQGIGAVAVQAHASEVSKLFFLYPLSFILPQFLVRYAFFFLTLLLGTLGVYFFLNYIFSKRNFWKKLASFVGSLFYLLNLATVQQYYVPFEMFAIYFTAVPWIFLLVLRYLNKGGRKNLLLFTLALFFSSSMAHTPTLFYVFFASVILFLFFFIILNLSKLAIKRSFVLVFIYILINLFWIAPNVYFLKNHAGEVEKSKIHSDFTPEAFLQSKDYGDIEDVALNKNFLFNWREYDFDKNEYIDLLDEWKENFNQPLVYQISMGLFVVSILGLFIGLIRRDKVVFSLFPVFLFSLTFLINENPPLTAYFEYLRGHSPLLREGLRFPFTKFSFIFTFPLSIFLSAFIYYIFDIGNWFKKQFLKLSFFVLGVLASVVITGGIIFINKPIFQGYLISPSMKVKIPREYFNVFDWFDKQDKIGRIVKLPAQTQWGWGFYNWNYQGAGFTWFGIPQPTFDREFDRWSPYNETFYNQISHVLYQYQLIDESSLCEGNEKCDVKNIKNEVSSSNEKVINEFEKVLEKYQVKHLLLDESVINAGGSNDLLFIPQIKDLIAHSDKITESAKFGFLTVYEVKGMHTDKWVWTPEKYIDVSVDSIYSQFDPVYSKLGNYVVDENELGYPFVNFDPRSDVDISIIKTASLSGEMVDNLLVKNKRMNAKVLLPIKERIVEDFGDDQGFKEGKNCDLKKKGIAIKKRSERENYYKAENGGVSCDYFYYPQVKNRKGYVLRIKGKNLSGRSLKIYLQNLNTKRMDLENLLPTGNFDKYFVLLPDFINDDVLGSLDKGYTLSVETRSFGGISSENIIEDIEFIPFDIDFFYSLRKGEESRNFFNNLRIKNVKKYGTGYYLVDVEVYSLTQDSESNRQVGLISLGQGYENGWQAFQVGDGSLGIKNLFPWFYGKKLKHVQVNGWENGWKIDNSKLGNASIVIIFWPQYLEFAGFEVLFLTFFILLIPFLRRKKKVYKLP